MDALVSNKLLSDNKIGNVNSNNTDIFGIGKAVAAFCEYKKLKITITQQNLEPLHHIIRKDILTTQPKTKDFIDKIFTLYEKGDPKISMATLRVIEYMDDDLLEAIEYFISYVSTQYRNDGKIFTNIDHNKTSTLNRYGVVFMEYSAIDNDGVWRMSRGAVCQEIEQILNAK